MQPIDVQTLAKLMGTPVPTEHIAKKLITCAIDTYKADPDYGIISYLIDQVNDYKDNQKLWQAME